MVPYRERLWPSPALLASLLLLLPATMLVFVPINWLAGVIIAVALYAGAVLVLLLRSPRISVDPEGLTVGAATLPASAIGDVAWFSGAEATAERGVRLDARAWLAIRGGISPLVRVQVRDTADPTPYWIVSTRHPQELARALETIAQ